MLTGSPRSMLATAVVVVVVTTTGLIWMATHAATFFTSVNPTQGTVSTNASVITDSTALGGKSIRFNAPVPPPPPPPTGGAGGTSGGCTSGSVVAPCIGSATTGASGWGNPVFDDEFSSSSLDASKWASSWFNGGSMNDVTTSANNVSVTGGNLVLTLSSSSSGALVSTNPSGGASKGFAMGYGYAEARIYFPGSGSKIYNWPAFWTDGQSWPANGEIDIAEGLGTLTSNYHSTKGADNSGTIAGTWSAGFHTYGVDRQSGKNSVYWDGKLVRSYATYDNGSPEYLIVNVGSGNTAALGTASQVKVDYVRVWQ